MRRPDFNRPFILQTDASNRGLGAVLSQIDAEGEEHLVAYFSRKLLDLKRREIFYYRERVPGYQVGHTVYLLGKPFTIQTDHRSLEWLDRLKENNARLTLWSLALQPYQFQVKYRTGKANSNADGLSHID